jgi:hypothetical protein
LSYYFGVLRWLLRHRGLTIIIPNRVLKECAEELAPIFTTMYQHSIDTGELPQDWLNANISCIYNLCCPVSWIWCTARRVFSYYFGVLRWLLSWCNPTLLSSFVFYILFDIAYSCSIF